jgi:hypothetical protein
LLAWPHAASAVVIESWENTLDGWQVPSPGGSNTSYSASFSSTLGVTNGSYSLAVGNTLGTAPNYSQLLLGPSTQALTTLLANSSAVSLDVYTPAASFGYFLQIDIDINNNDTGFQSLDGYDYQSVNIGSETTLTVPISSTLQSELAASTNPTQFAIQVGGGSTPFNETMYLDNLQAIPAAVPEPASLSILSVGGLAMLRRRRK